MNAKERAAKRDFEKQAKKDREAAQKQETQIAQFIAFEKKLSETREAHDRRDEARDQRQAKHDVVMRRHSWFQIVFAGAIVFATIYQGYVGSKQWDAMVKQNSYIIEQNESIVDQYDAMLDANKEMRRQNGIMEKQVAQTDKTLEMMQAEQRAWVRINPPIIEKCRAGEVLTVMLPLVNSGKTPARMKSIRFQIGVGPAGAGRAELDELFRRAINSKPFQYTFDLPPDTDGKWPAPFDVIDEDIVSAIRKNEQVVYILGRIDYQDAFGNNRETDFSCNSIGQGEPEGREMPITTYHNEMR